MASISIGELEFVPYRSRATRSTKGFTRGVGAPVVLGFPHKEIRPGRFKVAVIWGARPVQFTIRPTQKEGQADASRATGAAAKNYPPISRQQKQQTRQRANK